MLKKYFFLFLILPVMFLSQKQLTIKQIDSIYKTTTTDLFYNKEGVAIATDLYYQSKEINYTKGQIKSLRRLADLEAGLLNYAQSHQHIEELKPLALSENDYESYITACCLESKIFFYDRNYFQAKKTLDDASKYLPKIEDLDKRRKARIDLYIYRWWTIKMSESPEASYKDSLIIISKKICSEALLLKNEKLRANRVLFSANYAASSLVDENNITEAEKYLKIAEKQVKYIGLNSFPAADYFEAKGDFEYHNKEKNKNYLDSALANYNKAMKISEKIDYSGLIKKLYPKIAIIYGEKKDFEKHKLFTENGDQLKDSLEILSNNNLNELKQKLYKINTNENAENKETNSKIFIFLLFLIATIGIGIAIWKKYYTVKNHEIKSVIPPPEIPSENETKVPPANKILKTLQVSDHSFYLTFLDTHPNFTEKLLEINPTLKFSEIEFCAFIKLNLETKQIGEIKKMSIRAVESKKYRIRKKLNIAQEENMYTWMSKI